MPAKIRPCPPKHTNNRRFHVLVMEILVAFECMETLVTFECDSETLVTFECIVTLVAFECEIGGLCINYDIGNLWMHCDCYLRWR